VIALEKRGCGILTHKARWSNASKKPQHLIGSIGRGGVSRAHIFFSVPSGTKTSGKYFFIVHLLSSNTYTHYTTQCCARTIGKSLQSCPAPFIPGGMSVAELKSTTRGPSTFPPNRYDTSRTDLFSIAPRTDWPAQYRCSHRALAA